MNKSTLSTISLGISTVLLGISLLINCIVDFAQNIRLDKIEYYIELDKKWFDSIHNPINQPFLREISTELDIHIDNVTQEQFNNRYLKHE